ncbi:MAG: CpaF family protein [Actinomycetota bacterium]
MSTAPRLMDDEAVCERLRTRLLREKAELLSLSDPFERRIRLRQALGQYLVEEGVEGARLATLLRAVSDRVQGLGPLEPLMRDPDVTEVMVNGPDAIFVERHGRIERTDLRLGSEASVRHLIDRIVAPLGLRIDGSKPFVDARLPDGSRVHAILPPLAVTGPTITIRRFSRIHPDLGELVELDALRYDAAELLRTAVRERANIVVCGGAGTGKTTVLRALSAAIPEPERIITIEDAAELGLQREHCVALESRPANAEGRGEVTLRDLVRQSLRMRPDRIIVGEVRGAEVMDMLQAMTTGHDGSMGTVHANSPEELIVRLEAMAAMADNPLPSSAVRRSIASALDLIVHVARRSDGKRTVESIVRVHDHDGQPVLGKAEG